MGDSTSTDLASVGRFFAPYADGTAATDIEHIVALAEAYDSGLPEAQVRTFAGDLDNLTIAVPSVNRNQKSDRDAGEWGPPENRGWFASRIVAVKQEYSLSVNPAERDALADMLAGDASREVTCAATEEPEEPEEPHEPEEPDPTPILPPAGLVAFGLGLMLAGRRALRRMRH